MDFPKLADRPLTRVLKEVLLDQTKNIGKTSSATEKLCFYAA